MPSHKWIFAALLLAHYAEGESPSPLSARSVGQAREGERSRPLRRLELELHPTATGKRSNEGPPQRGGTVVSGRRLRSGSGGGHPCDLVNYDNVQYHVKIQIGSTSCAVTQTFQVIPDTGSSNLWVAGSNCTECMAHSAKYNVKQSCSAREVGDRVTFRYGDGTSASGGSMLDTVIIGDIEVQRQYMVLVDRMGKITNMQSDGILGLAHHFDASVNRSDSANSRTFIATLFAEHPNMVQQFSFYLTGDAKERSKLVFGDPDVFNHAKEHFQYGRAHYMKSTDLWLTSVWSIGLAGTGVEVSFPDRGVKGCPTLIDSGSSLIVLAPEVFDIIIADLRRRFTNCRDVNEQGILNCDCPANNDLSRIPSLSIQVIDGNDKQISLCMSPDEYILDSMNPLDMSASCVPAIQRGSHDQPVPIILGMTFMRSFYTNFDVKRRLIGFARSKKSPLPAGATCPIGGHPIVRRVIWSCSVLVALSSVLYMCVVLCARSGDEEEGVATAAPKGSKVSALVANS